MKALDVFFFFFLFGSLHDFTTLLLPPSLAFSFSNSVMRRVVRDTVYASVKRFFLSESLIYFDFFKSITNCKLNWKMRVYNNYVLSFKHQITNVYLFCKRLGRSGHSACIWVRYFSKPLPLFFNSLTLLKVLLKPLSCSIHTYIYTEQCYPHYAILNTTQP